ncbi:SPOR domain-containing protein [Maridesulfovibrio ferrireducens]|uniref:SPOR domain-containing protein n=1 Tax=Maridesulfovibrio ferrireducens TaxID=246191 RepID=UPI001A1C576A|nr:SPOR domain-containing protein [Maridesulfovibrio ferrireducens]MBI9112982.1 SPOR domain-containing protein [Maridesulfovibrio ferrireducens]
MAIRKKKTGSDSSQEKTYTFTFTVAEVIGLCSVCVAALCAFFVLGILLGRGYQPEKDVPELAMMMPTQSVNSSGEVKGGILKPEELQYMDQLKIKPETSAKPDQKPAIKVIVAKSETKTTLVTPVVKTEITVTAPAEPKQTVSVPEPPVEMDNPEAVAAPVFNYLYQVASFGSESKAQEFRDKLLTDGLDSSIETGKSGTKTWHRVLVRHIGSSESTQSMKNVLAKYGIKKPMLKSKKAVQ